MNEPLRDELLRMAQADQEARKAMIRVDPSAEAAAPVEELDRLHTARLREIVREVGWPGKSLVGVDGAEAAWLLLQHAAHDLPFMRRCLPLLEAAAREGEANPARVAFVVDRIRVFEGRPQLYGTQFRVEDGELVSEPIEDPEGVDERRAALGLGTVAERAEELTARYRAAGE